MRPLFSTFKLIIFGIWSLISIILASLLRLVRLQNGMEWVAKHFWPPFVLPLLQVKLEIENGDRIDPNESYLIMANHNSFVDIPVLFKTMPFYTYFIAKKELKKIPLLGWYIKAYGMIFIDRSNRVNAQKSIEEAAILIANGKHVIIFPEGTKSKDGKIAKFKKGGFHLADQAQVPILPIKIEGARNVWPNKKPFQLKKGIITVKVGKPIEAESLKDKDIGERAIFVREVISSL